MRRPTSRTAIHAIMRVMWQSCGLIIIEPPWFCSATPCLETRARASRGVYGRLTLNQRANPWLVFQKWKLWISVIISVSRRLVILPVLIEKIREKLARKEQVVLMLNRRGYSSLSCVVIVGVLTSVPTVIFPDAPHGHKTMNCHYCGFQKGILRPVQTVKVVPFVIMGRVRKRPTMNCRILPEARILRMDVDTTKKKVLMRTYSNGLVEAKRIFFWEPR